MGTYSTYDVLGGISVIIAVFSIAVLVVLGFLSAHLYRCLQTQDAALLAGKDADIRTDVLDVIKRAILWVIGYKGEDREKVSIGDVDLNWVSKYRTSIFFRFLPVYAVYILALVVLTRPILLVDGDFQIFKYSDNLLVPPPVS